MGASGCRILMTLVQPWSVMTASVASPR
ncbi:hypothetical protein [Enterobacter ludwigii]